MTLFGKMHVIFYLLLRPGFQFHVAILTVSPPPPMVLLLLLLIVRASCLRMWNCGFIPCTTTLSIQCRLCIHKIIRVSSSLSTRHVTTAKTKTVKRKEGRDERKKCKNAEEIEQTRTHARTSATMTFSIEIWNANRMNGSETEHFIHNFN